MKRKLCSVLLALCMVLTLLPVSAMAEGGTATSLPNADENGVITLMEDVTVNSFPSLTTVPLTIDLNGNKLTYTSAGTIIVPENANLTIKNGTLDAPNLANSPQKGTAAFFQVEKGATTELNQVIVHTSGSALYPRGDSARVTVKDSTIYCGVYAVGTNAAACENYGVIIELINSTFTTDSAYQNHDGDSSPVLINVPGTMKMENCTVNGTRHGVVVRGGNATIKNSQINLRSTEGLDGITGSPVSTYKESYWSSNWSSGNEVPMAALVVGNRHAKSYQYPAYCELENVVVTAPDNYKTVYVHGNNSTDQKATLIYDEKSTLGEVVNDTPDNANVGIAVAQIGNTKYFSLAEAVAAVPTDNSSTTIEVLKDVEDGAAIDFVSGQNVVINFNGHTYSLKQRPVGSTGTVNQGFRMLRSSTVILNNGTLDLAEVEAGKSEPFLMLIHSYSTVTLNNFNVDARTNNSYTAKNNAQIPCGQYAIDVDAGTFTINGNSNITARDGWVAFVEDHWNGSYPEGVKVIFGNDFSGTVTGEFSYGSEDVAITKENKDNCLLQIGGNGTFNTGDFKINTVKDFWTNNKVNEINNIVISGGTFDFNPTAYVADTHIARKDSDTKFTVVAKSNLTSGVYTSDPSSALAPGYVSYKNSDNSTYTVYYPVPVTPGNTSSSTTKNPDGSTTTTTTDKTTGTVTETTKNPDGSTTTVETKKDGSVTETNKTAGGSVGTVKSDANGNTEISASISAADVSAAAKKNEPVAAPVSVAPAASPAAAPVIKLSVPASAGEVSVVIPVTNAQQGTVAIKVNPDGTEEIIKTSVVTKDGVVLGVKGSTQIKIVNNDKDFADTVGHWAESDVDFVSARELFTGTAPQTFSPESATTRGMVVTVLARLAGESTDGGANWYDKGCAWAVTNGVSDGTDPNGTVTREQLAAMLYRYFGSPAVSGSLSFADASSVSEYAHDAMQWCVNNGIINGMDGLLNPQGQATRAQVSAMFARYIRLAATK